MLGFSYFTIDQNENIAVVTWTPAAVSPMLDSAELMVQLKAFVKLAKPRTIIVSFARLELCSSSLVGVLVNVNRLLREQDIRLMLCELSPVIRDKLDRLHLDQMFEKYGALSEAISACEESRANGDHNAETETND